MAKLHSGLLIPVMVVSQLWGCSGSDAGGTAGNGGSTSQSSGGGSNIAGANTVGGSSAQAGSAAISPAAGGAAAGGSSGTGGFSGTGGNAASTGGNPAGGSSATGGAVAGGGTSAATGGTKSTGGNSATGGTKATGGTLATGGSSTAGGAATCTVPSGGTHKWAMWPMPNPAGFPGTTASYTTANGVVHDNVTGLDWQQTPPTTSYTNADAITYCDGLSLNGFTDWRMPTRVEMASIVDWTAANSINSAFTAAGGFHKTGSNWILTINQTGAGAGTDYAWAFNMGDGIVSNAYSAATAARLRCVRGNGAGEAFSDPAREPLNHYSTPATGEVLDNCTGLIWQASGNASGLISWSAAVTYCQGLNLNGHTWRLPTVRELATLVDERQVAPAINRTFFPNTQYGARSNNWYWSSHNSRGSTTYAWALNFDDGFTGFNSGAAAWNTFGPSWAKCVR